MSRCPEVICQGAFLLSPMEGKQGGGYKIPGDRAKPPSPNQSREVVLKLSPECLPRIRLTI